MTHRPIKFRCALRLERARALRRVAVSILACVVPLMSPASPSGLEIVTFRSDVFGNERKLRILLPAGYGDTANEDRQYPVLYMNDGQNLFDAATSTFGGGEWRVDETVSRLESDGVIPPTIIVGIDHAGRRERAREQEPTLQALEWSREAHL